jgi:hypothetical protein
MKQIDIIKQQQELIKKKGFYPRFVSFNNYGYGRFIIESQTNCFPTEVLSMTVIVNPQQKHESVIVLSDPVSEYNYKE